MFILYLCLLIFLVFLFVYFFIEFIREIKFKNQKYITENTLILITGGCLGIGRELIRQLILNYKCTIINIDIRKDEFYNLKKEPSWKRMRL